MRKTTVLAIVVELVMAVLGLALGWEWARPLPEPPSLQVAVWLPTGTKDDGLLTAWMSQQVTSQGGQSMPLSEFKQQNFVTVSYLLSRRSVVYSYPGGAGSYLLYFGRDAHGQIWVAEESITGWLPMSQLPPRPYRSENYSLNVRQSAVEVTTSYNLVDAAMILFGGPVAVAMLLPMLYVAMKFVGELLYAVFRIRFQSPIVKDSG